MVYDLSSNQVKESVVMQSYSANLRGYRYTLDVGELRPVLMESGEIQLYDRDGENVIMVMPAPFLVDDAGEHSFGVDVTLTGTGSVYTLTYLLPQSWLASSERQWPVVLDPIVSANMEKSEIRDVSVYERNCVESYLSGRLDVGHNTNNGTMQTYIKFRGLPELTSADVIVGAQLLLELYQNNSSEDYPIEVHKVLSTWESKNVTWTSKPAINENVVEDYAIVRGLGIYQWEITDVVREWYDNANTGLVLKASSDIETSTSSNSYQKAFYSSDYSVNHRPALLITFRNNNGLESYWDYTASSAGRAGTGYVNNYTGNLVWVHNDIGYGGNLMPVSISHVYNANDSQNNDYGMGYGWRTNYNQTVTTCTLPFLTEDKQWYVWTDSDGTAHYFYPTDNGKYQDEDGLDLVLTPETELACTITDKNGNTFHFDTEGHLYKMVNDQKDTSETTVTYSAADKLLISTVTDGVGRKYNYIYTNGLLTRISYTGSGGSEVGYITFGYSENCLTSITYQDEETVAYGYGANNLLTSAEDIDGYRLEYAYYPVSDATWQPYRVQSVSEFDETVSGGSLTIEYGHNQTTFTDLAGNVQTMQFNNWGNTISIQDGLGRAQFATYAPTTEDTDKGNQLTLSSKLQNTVASFLKANSFENGDYWTDINSNSSHTTSTAYSYLGSKSLKMVTTSAGTGNGVHSTSFVAHVGRTVTFSAYVRTSGSAKAYLALSQGTAVLAKSEVVSSAGEWTRLEVSWTNNGTANVTIRAQFMSDTAGTAYMDCTQVEFAETASRYNIIENGDFSHGVLNWIKSEKMDGNDAPVQTYSHAAPLVSGMAFQIVGEPENKLRIRQEVPISGVEGDTYVLAGWAKGDGVPLPSDEEKAEIIANGDYPRTFTVRGTFLYTDDTTGEFNFDFNPDQPNWQYAAGVMVAEKAYSGIKVQVLYDYNANTVYFDAIQLYKEEFGGSYTYDDNGNVTAVKDLQGQITKYEYSSNNADLLRVIQDNKAKVTYTYDDWHNVKTAITEEGIVYSFTYDDYGNNTSVSIEYGGSAITSSARYTADGNRLDYTVDALGKMTKYSYNANTNVLEWMEAPNDSEATRTNYTYDDMYRVTTVSANVVGLSEGTALTATYGYTDDLLTSITTGSTTYTFNYGDFSQRSSIQISSRILASYEYNDYENFDNNYLKKLVYGNGNVIEYTYDQYGRLTAQVYKDDANATTGDTVTYKYDSSGGLATVIDSASGITSKYFYDVTDRLMKYTENGTNYSQSVAYTYDKLNNLTSETSKINNITHTTSYTYDDDNRVTTVTNTNSNREYTYDGFGRIVKQVTKHQGTVVLTETFTYVGNSAQVASKTSVSNGYSVTYSYTYDDNGNIATVNDGTYTTRYTYDTANQLVREDNQEGNKTLLYFYDNAGNITEYRTYAYTLSADTSDLTPVSSIENSYEDSAYGSNCPVCNKRKATIRRHI